MSLLLAKYTNDSVRTYVSDYAGAGKSFRVRRSLCKWHKYAYIPTTSVTQFLSVVSDVARNMRTIEEIDGETEEWEEGEGSHAKEKTEGFLHIDIFDTVGFDFNSYLFELLFFHGFYDLRSGSVTHFPPAFTRISIEIASSTNKGIPSHEQRYFNRAVFPHLRMRERERY